MQQYFYSYSQAFDFEVYTPSSEVHCLRHFPQPPVIIQNLTALQWLLKGLPLNKRALWLVSAQSVSQYDSTNWLLFESVGMHFAILIEMK